MIDPGDNSAQHGQEQSGLKARIVASLLHYRPQLIALAVRGLSVVAGFAVTYMLGRQFGAAVTGQYALVTQTAMFLAVFALFGLDVSVVRHFARAVAEQAKLALSVVLAVLGISFAMLTFVIGVLWIGGEATWRLLFGNVVGIEALLVLSVLLVGRGGVQLVGGLLRSQHRFSAGIGVTALAIPAATGIALATGVATNLNEILWITALAAIGASMLGLVPFFLHVSASRDALRIPIRYVLSSSLPLWGAGLALVMGEWYGLAVAARILGASEAGLYRVSFQLSGAIMMITSTLFSVYAAQISTAFHSGNREQAAIMARSAVRLSAALAIPMGAALIIGGNFLLGQIGPEFPDAFPALTVLAIGQILIALLGPSGLVLAMSGNERTNLLISIIGTGTLFIVAPLAAIHTGLTGLAASVATILFARNLAAFVYVKRRLGIDIWTGKAR